MRLTLRTLLAYLDDVLAPEATKDIGHKIQESPMAQLLVSRIREVMRRRRLKAPDVSGPEIGIDPNIISQYLDNTLPAEQYADVERVLLASDELLAETASCHQILALALGDPSEINPAIRDRLYALGPVDPASQLFVAGETDLEVKSRTSNSVAALSTLAGGSVSEPRSRSSLVAADHSVSVPDYLKPAPVWKSLFPSAVVIVLVMACLWLFIPSVKNGLRQANTELQRKGSRSTPAQGANELRLADNDLPESKEDGQMDDPSDAPGNDRPVGVEVADEVPLGDKKPVEPVDENAVKEPVVDSPVREGDGTKVTSRDANEGDPLPPAPAPSAEKSDGDPLADKSPLPEEILADLQIPYTSVDGVLIRRDPVKQRWFVVPRQSAVHPEERIANVEPFEGRLEFENAGVRMQLIGDCVLELLAPNRAVLQGIDIGRGRYLFQSKIKNGENGGAIGIKIGKDLWRLQLTTIDTVCALEVKIEPPFQYETRSEARWYQATLYVISGVARWTNGAGKTLELPDGNALEISPERLNDAGSAPFSIAAPEWTEASKRRTQPAFKRVQTTFEKAFEPNQPVEESMLAVITGEKNAKVAGLAARCLSAMDNYPAMVQTLATCDHEEARFAARDGLREWLPMSPANGTKLMKELQAHYPDLEAETIYKMLWGFSREEVKSSLTKSLQFTQWMASPRREIRELAEYWVKLLVGNKIEYKALNPPATRDAQVRRIEDMIHRNKGLIKGL